MASRLDGSVKGAATVEFRRSLLHSIVLDLSYVSLAEEYEGFDQWVYSTRASMSADLREEIETVFNPFANTLLLHLLHTTLPEADSMPAAIRWVATISEAQVETSNQRVFHKLAAHTGGDAGMCDVTSRDDAALREIFARWAPERDADRVMRLLRQPEELKAEIVYILTRFWDRHLKPEYERCRLLEERSIRYYAEHPPVGSARTLFTEVTGREYPSEHLPPVERTTHLVFLPTCHGGPYVSAVDVHGDGRTLVVTYNCRPTAGGDRRVGIPIGEVFPPLKGLADETRLEILSILTEGEFYAQQIVDRLEISQSAVSRHLRLMVACGVLRERRQDGMKFYSVNESVISDLIEHLGALRSNRGA